MFTFSPVDFNWLFIFICIVLEGLFLFRLVLTKKSASMKNGFRFISHGSLLVELLFLFIFTDEVSRHYLLQGRKGAMFLVNGSFKFIFLGVIGLFILNEFLFRKKRRMQKGLVITK